MALWLKWLYLIIWMDSQPHLSPLAGNSHTAILIVLDRSSSLLDQCAVTGGREECRDACPSSSYPLCQRALQENNILAVSVYVCVWCVCGWVSV